MATQERRRAVAGLALTAMLAASWTAHASAELAAARVCRKAINVQGRAYAVKRLGLVLGCAGKLLKCELVAEVDGVAAAECRAKVADACARRIGPQPDSSLAKAALRFDGKIGTVCQTSAFDYVDVVSTGPGGLWFGNDPACGASIDLPTFLVCHRDALDAHLDALASSLQPRTAILLDNVGLGSGFPHLVRPPTVEVTLAATAPGSGVLVPPGTIVVPAGSALRVTGDASTLGCAPSANNGRVAVRVGTGSTAQELTLHEPYGSSDGATFGPWVSAASLPYTIELKDGACESAAAGTVSVP